MMRWLVLALAACGESGPDLHVTTSFTLSQMAGVGPSSLDVLYGQPITLDLVFDGVQRGYYETTGCRSTRIAQVEPARVATPPEMQTLVLDMLPEWAVELQLCDVASESNITIDSVIDPLNLTIGCLDLPASANVYDGTHPKLTSFEGMRCSATLLDVVFNRVLTADGFVVRFE